MRRHVIAAHLLRVDRSLSLDHPLGDDATAGGCRSADWTPAVLIIPRGGNPREPHLVTLENPHGSLGRKAPACVMTDPHTVLCAEDFGAGGDRLAADVVVHRGTNGHRDPLDQMPWALYPSGDEMDCDVAVSRRATTCVLRIRNSSRIEIDGPAALLARAAPRWLTVYGSVLHCWVAAGMPIDLLGDAVVAAGRYYVGVTRRERHFSVAGRANVQVQRSRPTAAMSHAA